MLYIHLVTHLFPYFYSSFSGRQKFIIPLLQTSLKSIVLTVSQRKHLHANSSCFSSMPSPVIASKSSIENLNFLRHVQSPLSHFREYSINLTTFILT